MTDADLTIAVWLLKHIDAGHHVDKIGKQYCCSCGDTIDTPPNPPGIYITELSADEVDRLGRG